MVRMTLARRLVLAVAAVGAMLPGGLAGAEMAAAVDTEAPVLTALSADRTEFSPDQPVTFSYEADEASGQLTGLTLTFTDPTGVSYSTEPAPAPLPLQGSVTLRLPDGVRNGTYQLTRIVASDAAGNSATLARLGTVSYKPTGATGPTRHTVDFSLSDLTMAGSTPDAGAPELVAVSVAEPRAPYGGNVSVSYRVIEPSRLRSLLFTFMEPRNRTVAYVDVTGDDLARAGNGVAAVASYWTNGDYTLTRVTAVDSLGNVAGYGADGSISRGSSSAP